MLQYIIATLSFATAAIAVFGETSERTKNGRKLLPLGRIALTVGILTFVINYYIIYSDHIKKEETYKKEMSLLKPVLKELLDPFKKLMSFKKCPIGGKDYYEYYNNIDSFYYAISTKDFTDCISSVNLRYKYNDSLTWEEYIKNNNASVLSQLTSFLSSHSIDGEARSAIDNLLNNQLFSSIKNFEINIQRGKQSENGLYRFKESTVGDIFKINSPKKSSYLKYIQDIQVLSKIYDLASRQ